MRVGKADGVEGVRWGEGSGRRLMFFFFTFRMRVRLFTRFIVLRPQYMRKEGGDRGRGFGGGRRSEGGEDEKETLRFIKSQTLPSLIPSYLFLEVKLADAQTSVPCPKGRS